MFPLYTQVDEIEGLHDEWFDADTCMSSHWGMQMAATLNSYYEHLADYPAHPDQTQAVTGHNHGRSDDSEHLDRQCGLSFGWFEREGGATAYGATDPIPAYTRMDTQTWTYDDCAAESGCTNKNGIDLIWRSFKDTKVFSHTFRCTRDVDRIVGPSIAMWVISGFSGGYRFGVTKRGVSPSSGFLASDNGTIAGATYPESSKFVFTPDLAVTDSVDFDGWLTLWVYVFGIAGSTVAYEPADVHYEADYGTTTTAILSGLTCNDSNAGTTGYLHTGGTIL